MSSFLFILLDIRQRYEFFMALGNILFVKI